MEFKDLNSIDEIEKKYYSYWDKQYRGDIPKDDSNAKISDFDKYKEFNEDESDDWVWRWKSDTPDEVLMDYYDLKHYWNTME